MTMEIEWDAEDVVEVEATKLSRLASQLLDDVDAIGLPRFSEAWTQQAVGLVLEAFEAAHYTNTQGAFTCPHGKRGYVSTMFHSVHTVACDDCKTDANERLAEPPMTGYRYCSKCSRNYKPSAACPHFAPYRQIS